jgi:hypothetical protein
MHNMMWAGGAMIGAIQRHGKFRRVSQPDTSPACAQNVESRKTLCEALYHTEGRVCIRSPSEFKSQAAS